MSVDAAYLMLSDPVLGSSNSLALPSISGANSALTSHTIQWTATLQGLAKQPCEAPDAHQHVGKCKCVYNKENLISSFIQSDHKYSVT